MAQPKKILEFLRAKENRLGVIILIIGFFALVTVMAMAFGRLGGQKSAEEFYQSQQGEIIIPPAYIAPVKNEKPKYKRQTDITQDAIQGAWEIKIKNGKALLQINKGLYKIAIIMDGGGLPNLYSVGQYSMRDDLLIFEPNTDYRIAQNEFRGYRILTRSKFSVMVLKKGKKLIFQKPTRDMGVYVPPRHPLLHLTEDNVAEFNLLK